MAMPNKVRQRRWRERQKDKKQVTIMMSEEAYELLAEKSKSVGKNFSSIVDKAVLSFLQPVNPPIPERDRGTDKETKHSYLSNGVSKSSESAPTESHRQLRKKIAVLVKEKKSLQEDKEKFQLILNNCRDAIWLVNLKTKKIEYVTPSSDPVVGITSNELKGRGVEDFFSYLHPDDHKEFKKIIKKFPKISALKRVDHSFEYRTIHPKIGAYRWVSGSRALVYNKNDEPVAIVLNTKDIHRRKQAELALQELRDELESKVKTRTASLEEANIALTLMLKKESELKAEFEGNILSNLKELVLPYVEKLKKSRLDVRQKNYIDLMEVNLNKIASPFLRKLSSGLLSLTPTEIQVADLIRHGKNTKEIADLLNLSARTVEFYRASIRGKIGIKYMKISLRSYLMTFE